MNYCIFLIWIIQILLPAVCVAYSSEPMQRRVIKMTCLDDALVADMKYLSVKETIRAVRTKQTISKFHDVNIVKAAPSISRIIVANPKSFFENPSIAKLYGFDVDAVDSTTPLAKLAPILPVIYVAETHPEYGTLGFLLNRISDASMSDLYPTLRTFRQRPVYLGGVNSKGAQFTMLHRKTGFPENR